MNKKNKPKREPLHIASVAEVKKNPDAFADKLADKILDEVVKYQKKNGIEPLK